MPKGQQFWNPYRWVTASDQAIEHEVPSYHHRLSGLSGRLWCELEALTPLFIGDGKGKFACHARSRKPYIPATSLKGAIRSLAELVGNAAVQIGGELVDEQHELGKARRGSHLDIVARTFGCLDGHRAFSGLIRFSDAELTELSLAPNRWPNYNVIVGQPRKHHSAFYLSNKRRKFYHHHTGATQLRMAPSSNTQNANVRPAPPGTRFDFTVDFKNLRDEELNLLVYCLVLEEQSTVRLSAAAVGSDGSEVTLRGPLRHKFGGAKPSGAGSVHLRVTELELCTDPLSRYRGHGSTIAWEGADLNYELDRRTASFRERTDQTMQELRAMLIYCDKDPRRASIRYPAREWFKNESRTELKPTT